MRIAESEKHENRGTTTESSSVRSIRETLQQAFDRGDVKRVYGEPIERNGRTIIPIADTGALFGFGSGSGGNAEGSGDGGGGGGKVAGKPIGFLEIDEKGTRFRPVFDANRLGAMGILAATFLIWFAIRRK